MRVAFLALLLGAPALAGCFVQDTPHMRLAGTADGYTPLSTGLLLYVTAGKAVGQAAFERHTWYLAALEKEFRARRDVTLEGTTEAVSARLNVTQFVAPEDLTHFRYDKLGMTPEARTRADHEWDVRLAALGEGAFIRPSDPAAAGVAGIPSLPPTPSTP